MSFDDLWAILEAKNPVLMTSDVVRMTPRGFKKAVRLAYDEGYKTAHGKEESFDFGDFLNKLGVKR